MYEGEIKKVGDKVIIRTVPDVVISHYQKGQTVNWQNLESPGVELDIDKAEYFAFKMDKIDAHQMDIDLMNKASDDASQQMKIVIDTEFLSSVYVDAAAANKGRTAGKKSGAFNLGYATAPIGLTKTNVLDYLIDMETVGDEQDWPSEGRWVCIPAWMAGMINKSDLKDVSLTGDDKSTIRNGGRIGKVSNWNLYKSNLVYSATDGAFTGATAPHQIMFGHQSGITFAAQLVETEFHEKLETTFGSGMKGLNVYGHKVIKPEALGILYAYKAT